MSNPRPQRMVDRSSLPRWKFYSLIFWETFKISACTFGGGYIIMTLIQEVFVERYGWLSREEALNLMAIAQSSPGPMALNTASLIGYKLGGTLGASCAVAGTTIPPLVVIGVLASYLDTLSQNQILKNFFWGANLAIAAIIIEVTWGIGQSVYSLGGRLGVIAGLLAAVVIFFYSGSTPYLILLGGLLGYLGYFSRPQVKGD